ncbi:GrpB family protein [Nocardia uniformis]|uniref:GrpB family protein n=1 Tax=Nocardia uniformis TaxID=53432 RepID=A0A849C8Z8_9NOCA|nr:GrpB family protein [Nocardia uniformis]NNH74208.1 GrpB family protein [Nocardia uniformis]
MATSGSDDDLAAATIGELKPYAIQVVLEDYNPRWPNWYAAEAASVRDALGSLVLRLEHTGSTSVPGLAAKPVIDILLAVPDTTDEAAYIPALEGIGYTLRIREPHWYEHRCLIRRVEDGAPYNVNLHVFSPELAAVEIERMLAFRDRLRTHDGDRAYYDATKRELAQRSWKYVQHYADAKSDVVEAIMARALQG